MELIGLGFIAGLASAPHCLGMCGGFPLHLARASAPGQLLGRQVLYILGKGFTYVFLGALLGFAGGLLVNSPWVSASRTVLAALAGAIMIGFGLRMLGLLRMLGVSRRLPGLAIQDWGPIQQLYQAVFQAPGLWAAFVLGLLTGFLPCPVTAAVLVAAAATHSVARGMLLMAALGLGTAPVLLGVGLSSGLLTTRFQKIGLKAAGVVLILLGAITVLRGSDVLHRYLGHCPHQSSQTTPIHHDLR